MAWYRIAENVLDAIANAINAKTGHTAPMTPVEMVSEIGTISGGGGVVVSTGTITPASDTVELSLVHNLGTFDVMLYVWLDSTNYQALVDMGSNTQHRAVNIVLPIGSKYSDAGRKAFYMTTYRNANVSTGTATYTAPDINSVTINSGGTFKAGLTYNWMAVKYGENTTNRGV